MDSNHLVIPAGAKDKGLSERFEKRSSDRQYGIPRAEGFSSPHILESQQGNRDWLENSLFPLTNAMEVLKKRGGDNTLKGKRIALLFCEESTRTETSFDLAADLLGAKTFRLNAVLSSMYKKDESFEDTVKVFSTYPFQAMVVRSKEAGQARFAAEHCPFPITNAGDGKGQHPTQAFLDLYTLKRHLGGIDGGIFAIMGDLARGRTVHSLAYLFGKFKNVFLYLVSHPFLQMPDDIKGYLTSHGVGFKEITDIREVANKVDGIYQTRQQKERSDNGKEEDYPLVSKDGYFRVDREVMGMMKPSAFVLHPLPRKLELSEECDADPRSIYFKQAGYGVPLRMALFKMQLG